jgi:hypothetical protein
LAGGRISRFGSAQLEADVQEDPTGPAQRLLVRLPGENVVPCTRVSNSLTIPNSNKSELNEATMQKGKFPVCVSPTVELSENKSETHTHRHALIHILKNLSKERIINIQRICQKFQH